MKKVMAIILTIALVVMVCPAVFAEEAIDEQDYVVTYSCEPITDIEGLTELALQQKAKGIATRTAQLNAEANNDDGLLTAEQLIEVREYADGTIEEDYAFSNLSLGSMTDPVEETTRYSSNYVTGYNVVATFYYTIQKMSDDIYISDFKYRANKVVTSITKYSYATTSVSSIAQSIFVNGNQGAGSKEYYYNNSVNSTQIFTLSSTDRNFYDLTIFEDGGAPLQNATAYSDVYFGDGNSINFVMESKINGN